MGANRIVHAIPALPSMRSKAARLIYMPLRPINVLVNYYGLRTKDLDKTLSRLQDIRDNICGNRLLVLDCGVYSIKSQYGLIAQIKDVQPASYDYLGIRDAVMERYGELVEYVKDYAQFLKLAYNIYDYAFDFDADTMIGGEDSDKLSQIIFDVLGDNRLDKLARTYHIARMGVEEWWEDLCQDSRFSIVAVEGGSQHRSTNEFYYHVIDMAHRRGKKVHVLAISGASFPKEVPADYMDAATHSMGGQKALIQTPWGTFQFGKHISERHILSKPPEVQDAVAEFVKGYGFDFEELLTSPDAHYLRQRFNILFMNDYWDVEYAPSSGMEKLF